MKKKDTLNILVAINSKFIMPLTVMLTSLFYNNKSCNIHVFLLYSKLTTDEVKSLELLCSENGKNFTPIFVDKKIFKHCPVYSIWSVETYYRLATPIMLDLSLDRVLYLDADTIINHSVYELYNTDFEGNFFVACPDVYLQAAFTGHLPSLDIKISDASKYFNAGVLLMNLKLLRESYNLEEIFDMIKVKRSKLKYLDQDLLNMMYHNKVKIIDAKKYNCTLNIYDYIDHLEYKIRKHSVVIHYNGLKKPWNYDYCGHYDDLFWKYAKETKFKPLFYKYILLNFFYRIYVNALVNPIKYFSRFLN